MRKLIILSLITIIFIAGCVEQQGECADCPNPTSWSECNQNAIKTRTNYQCNEQTNYTCESYTEEKACLTEIILKGSSMQGTISPTLDETVKDIITVEITSVPDNTNIVAFLVIRGSDLTADSDEDYVFVKHDNQQADGWKALINTTEIDNGLYTVFAGATYEGAPDNNLWLDMAVTQIIVKN
jgi:hypothetical protein